MSYRIECKNPLCKRLFVNSDNKGYCSKECNLDTIEVEEYSKNYYGIAPGTIGAIGELKVSCDLLEKGWEVFRSVSPHSKCDIVISKGSINLRIEVRKGHKNKDGTVKCGMKITDKADHYAIWLDNCSTIYYLPELPNVV